MAKTIDPALARKLRRESEQTMNDPYPAATTGRRPNRQKVVESKGVVYDGPDLSVAF